MYIDYSVIVSIFRQISFIISNIDKLNLRLMRAFQYLSMFDLFVRHKINKTNIVSDALSRLSRNSIIITKDDSRVLKILYEQVVKIINDFSFKEEKSFSEKLSIIYYVILMKMFDDFKSRLLLEYIKNKK